MIKLRELYERNQQRVELVVGAGVVAFGGTLGVLAAAVIVFPWLVGVAQIVAWIGGIV